MTARNWRKTYGLLILGFIGLAGTTAAQPVFSAPTILTAPPPPSPSSTSRTRSLSSLSSAFTKQAPLAMWGPVAVRPHISYRIMYGDGLLTGGEQEAEGSVVQSLSTGVLFELGTHWHLDYTVNQSYYSDETLSDSTDHSASLSGSYAYRELQIGLSLGYSKSSPLLIETGGQTRQESYSTSVSASYPLGSRTSLSVSLSRSARLSEPLPQTTTQWQTADLDSWSNTDSLNYKVTRELDVGVNLTVGWDDLDFGSDMQHMQLQGQVSWQPTPKLSVSAQAGAERRKFLNSESSDLSSPVYSGSIGYRPFQTTSFSFSASRSVSASYFADQAIKGTGWSLSMEQRLLQRLFWSVSMSRNKTHYFATDAGILSGRNDRSSSYGTRLGTTILKRAALSMFYNVSRNRTNTEGFAFTSHQTGAEIQYSF